MEQAFFLKYRSQKITELDSADVREGLLKILESGKVPHALLFAGPRGTGKTSAARIIAKVVNCERGEKRGRKRQKLGEPCNRCKACLQITAGTALDLLEIDAASTRGIDDIRNLREKVKLAPTQLKNKVYIIDEVHMLTTEAFNALLKTLEEPPAHTIFILCTTAPEKLPQTIVSRCTSFNFRKAKVGEVIRALDRVIKGEKLKVEKGVVEEIAKSVDGSFRDGQKILDQLAGGRKKITLTESKKLLGRIESLSPGKLLSFLSKKELVNALLEVDRIVTVGGDLAVYTHQLLDQLRLGLLAKAGLTVISEPEETGDFSLPQIRFLIELFSRAAAQIKTNPIPQLPLELAIVEWCEEEKDAEVARRNFDSASDSARNPASRDTGQARENRRPAPLTTEGGFTGSQSEASQNLPGSPRPQRENLEEILAKWPEVLAGIRPLNHSVEALLRATKPAKIKGEVLTLEVFYRFHKERLEEERCRRIVEEVATQILGQPIKLKCVLGIKKPATTDDTEEKTDNADSDIIKAAEEIFGTNAD